MDSQPIFFTLSYNEEMGGDTFSVYMLLMYPNNDEENTPVVIGVLPIFKENLEIFICDTEGNAMSTGTYAEYTDENEEEISMESVKDAIMPRIVLLLSMVITGHNFLVPEEQIASEMEDKLNVSTEELPQGEKFTFNTVEDFLNSTKKDH